MRVRTRLVSASIALLIGVGVLCVGGGATAAPDDVCNRQLLQDAGRGRALRVGRPVVDPELRLLSLTDL